MVNNLVNNGDELAQLAFIDHFPSIFFAPGMGLDLKDTQTNIDQACWHFILSSVSVVCEMARRDSGGNLLRRDKLADGIWECLHGKEVAPFLRRYTEFMKVFLEATFRFMGALPDSHQLRTTYPNEDALAYWIKTLECPITLFVADKGIRSCIAKELQSEWVDLGIRRFLPKARIVELDTGHFDILKNPILVEELQKGWFHKLARL